MCTLKYEKLAKLIFEEKGISSLLDTVRGTDEAGQVTKAECIRRAVSDFGIEPPQALMVGDTVNDLKGAEEAGVPFLGVSWGFGFEKGETLPYGSLIDRPEEVLEYL